VIQSHIHIIHYMIRPWPTRQLALLSYTRQVKPCSKHICRYHNCVILWL